MEINSQQLQQIIAQAPPGVSSQELTQALLARGHTLAPGTQIPGQAPVDGAQLHDTGSFLGNLGHSAGSFLGGIGQAIEHPINTVENIGKGLFGAGENLAAAVTGGPKPTDNPSQIADSIGHFFKQRYGSLDAIKTTAYQDPIGLAADLSMFLSGAGGAVSKVGDFADAAKAADLAKGADFFSTAGGLAGANTPEALNALKTPGTISQIGNTLSHTGEVINPINVAGKGLAIASKPLGMAVDLGKKLATYGVSQETGFNPETIKTIMNQPDEFSKTAMASYSREALGSQIKSSIDSLRNNVSETGKDYNVIRNTPGSVAFSPNTIPDILKNYGITIKDGQIVHDINSVPMAPGDIKALQGFIDKYGIDANGAFRSDYTPNGILNTRQALDSLIPYDSTTKTVSDKLTGELRAAFDTAAKDQVPNLSATDAKFAPIRKELGQATRDFINPDGSLKDGAASKIMSAGKAGKESLLARMEKLSPGITDKIKVQAAIEDIQHAGGQKVGTYLKAGQAVGGFLTLNPALIALTIAASPGNATQILRGFGKLMGVQDSVMSSILKSNGFSVGAKAVTIAKKAALPAAQLGKIKQVSP